MVRNKEFGVAVVLLLELQRTALVGHVAGNADALSIIIILMLAGSRMNIYAIKTV